MLCPSCTADDTKVVDSRLAEDGGAIRRRRQCLSCDYRFTTFERVEAAPLLIKKSNGSTETFDRDKLLGGIRAATKGRSVEEAQILEIASGIERSLRAGGGQITSSQIGLAVLDGLRDIDEVAYMRFASVYKNFGAATDFESELELLKKLSAQA